MDHTGTAFSKVSRRGPEAEKAVSILEAAEEENIRSGEESRGAVSGMLLSSKSWLRIDITRRKEKDRPKVECKQEYTSSWKGRKEEGHVGTEGRKDGLPSRRKGGKFWQVSSSQRKMPNESSIWFKEVVREGTSGIESGLPSGLKNASLAQRLLDRK